MDNTTYAPCITRERHPPHGSLSFAVVVLATITAQLVGLAYGRVDEARSFSSVIVPSTVFLAVVTIPTAALGIVLGRLIGVGTPLLDDVLSGQPGSMQKLRKDVVVASLLGLIFGAVLLLTRAFTSDYLQELPAYGHRGVTGGLAVSIGAAIGEEVWFRLGVMTLLLWAWTRLRGERSIQPIVAWSTIVLASVAFAMAHLPQLAYYGAMSAGAISGTIVGNAAVGILYGWCYWRRSLIAAMAAHFSVDLVIHVMPAAIR